MISVVGEALVDLVITPDGSVDAKLGGAPYNTARACARLGASVRFVGAVSLDRFGSMLADQLAADGVDVSSLERVDVPTTLAAAELDDGGAATYRFYIDGTSAPALASVPAPPAPAGETDMLFTGGLALVLEPMASTVERALVGGRDRLVVVDVNCRPLVVPDREAYVDRIDRVLRHTDVVKVSDEDLAYLRPGVETATAAHSLLDLGPVAVLITQGGAGTVVTTSDAEVTVPTAPVEVVDTIGAGDSFGGGFLAWWASNGLDRSDAGSIDVLAEAVHAANQVAGVVVGRRGADPPWRHELDAAWSERSG